MLLVPMLATKALETSPVHGPVSQVSCLFLNQTRRELAGLGGAGFVLASWWEVPPVRAGLAGLNGFTLV